MRKNISLILIVCLLFSMMNFWRVSTVSASPAHRIILPFHTSWENPDALGVTNSLESIKDFYGYNGPNNPLQPELGGVTTRLHHLLMLLATISEGVNSLQQDISDLLIHSVISTFLTKHRTAIGGRHLG